MQRLEVSGAVRHIYIYICVCVCVCVCVRGLTKCNGDVMFCCELAAEFLNMYCAWNQLRSMILHVDGLR
jgi:hypothetical protein